MDINSSSPIVIIIFEQETVNKFWAFQNNKYFWTEWERAWERSKT